MRSIRQHTRSIHTIASVVYLSALICCAGCATVPLITVQAHRYRIEVALNLESHQLVGRTALDLVRKHTGVSLRDDPRNGPRDGPLDGPIDIEFKLHSGLKVTRVYASGAQIQHRSIVQSLIHATTVSSPIGRSSNISSTHHRIRLDHPVDSLTLFIEYEGKLYQEVSAGEVPGQIHNQKMRAHIGTDGIYLADGNWYPTPASNDQDEPGLADFILLAQRVDGFELVASGHHDPRLGTQTGGYAWRTPYPAEKMVLVGGAHEIHHTDHHGVALRAHLKPDQARFADGLLDAAGRILDRYEPLIGPYPAREFSIVDNFFSSGFAYPTFTLLSSAVIEMGERSQTAHGYIDHEMLHSWWGNGIYVDPKDGNWCEALTSYATNYYGYVLDGQEEEARRKRRNYSHFLSRMKPGRDRPLGTYGQPGGCSRGTAYQKGAAVFHMLANKMGQENFWSAMRNFTRDYVGRHAGWDDIRHVCERQSGLSLETFFRQWVRSSSAPTLWIESARYHSGDQTLTLSVSQGEPAFELDVPVRITHVGGHRNVNISLRAPKENITIPVEGTPLTVEIDPDYHIFRKVPIQEILPTTASTRYGHAFTCVLPAGPVAEPYQKVKSIFDASFEDHQRAAFTVDQLEEGALAQRCVLILGEAVRHPYITGFLRAVEFPVRWGRDGFEFSGVRYTDPKDAVLCTVRHPGIAGGGITVIYSNSDQAIPRAVNIPMYEHSLILFENGKPAIRRDFEHQNLIRVKH